MKYKIGDKVKVINADIPAKAKFVGCTAKIRDVNPNGICHKDMFGEHYSLDIGEKFVFYTHELEPVIEKKIVITSDGTETLARLYEGKKVILTATAKCSPDDTFDFETGAKLAFERLMEKKSLEDLLEPLKKLSEAFAKIKPVKITFPVKTKPKYYNGKVVCVGKGLYAPYTVGKVYEFKDGRVADDRGEILPIAQEPIKTLEEWNNDPIKRAKFIPFVE